MKCSPSFMVIMARFISYWFCEGQFMKKTVGGAVSVIANYYFIFDVHSPDFIYHV